MKPQYIVIHHSATRDGRTLDWRYIRRYHVVHRGWNDIGYHFGLEQVDGEYEVLVGRPLNVVGAHCLGYNEQSIGVCFVGNFAEVPPSPRMIERSVPLLRWLVDAYDISPHKFVGHGDLKSTECPGRMFPLAELRDLVYG